MIPKHFFTDHQKKNEFFFTSQAMYDFFMYMHIDFVAFGDSPTTSSAEGEGQSG